MELVATHYPGVDMGRADALSRAYTGKKYRDAMERDEVLQRANRVRVKREVFRLINEL